MANALHLMCVAYIAAHESFYMATANFTIRLDSNLKKQSESMCNELGLKLTTAINAFLRKSIAVGGSLSTQEWKNLIKKP